MHVFRQFVKFRVSGKFLETAWRAIWRWSPVLPGDTSL